MGYRMRHPFVAATLLAGALFAVGAEAGPTDAALRALRQRDYARAAGLLSAPAASGDAEAQYQLGLLYRTGRGVTVDLPRARDLWLAAAQSGHAAAAYSLAVLLEGDSGVTADPVQARRWLQFAADHGHGLARERLSGAPAQAAPAYQAPAPQRAPVTGKPSWAQ